jgi:hypothetical protein
MHFRIKSNGRNVKMLRADKKHRVNPEKLSANTRKKNIEMKAKYARRGVKGKYLQLRWPEISKGDDSFGMQTLFSCNDYYCLRGWD